MRDINEIKDRLENYEKNERLVRDEHGKNCIKQAILELYWVLGFEQNRRR